MELLAPGLLALASLAIPIVLLYFLKLRRRKVAVSSTLLWQRTLDDLRVNAPFQRMKGSLLLVLQLLILFLIVFAVARLVMKGDATAAAHRVLLIDTSASMGAVETEDGKTRLDIALRAARDVIDNSPGDHHFCLIVFDRYAHNPLVNFTNEKTRLHRALDGITLTDMGTDPQEALRLAESLAATKQGAEIHIFSDGSFPEPPRVRITPTFVPIGEATENVAIVNFSARRRVTQPDRFDVAVTIANFGELPTAWELQITLNGDVIDMLSSNTESHGGPLLAAGDDPARPARESLRMFVIDDPRLTQGVVAAQLTRTDALPADNNAFLVLPPLQERRVLLLTDGENGNFYLEHILGTQGGLEVAPEVRAESAARERTRELVIDDHGYDVIVFDGVSAELMPESLPPGNYIYLNCAPIGEGWGLDDPMQLFPQPKPPADPHPITKYLEQELGSIQLDNAPTLTMPDWAEPVLLADKSNAPLIAFAQRNERISLVIGFDIYESTWPLELSFPVFWANTLRYLFRGTIESEVYAVPTDRAVSVLRSGTDDDSGAAELVGTGRVSDWRSGPVMISGDRRYHFGKPGRVGVYRVEIPGRPRQQIALNLGDPDESDIRPASSLDLQDASSGQATSVAGDDSVIHQNRELWPILLILAVIVLLLEWWVFHRRPFG